MYLTGTDFGLEVHELICTSGVAATFLQQVPFRANCLFGYRSKCGAKSERAPVKVNSLNSTTVKVKFCAPRGMTQAPTEVHKASSASVSVMDDASLTGRRGHVRQFSVSPRQHVKGKDAQCSGKCFGA